MKLIHTLRRVFSDKGLLLTLGLSITLLLVFYGPLLVHPSKTYFGNSGDGMQVYYQTLYHTKYDTEYWKQQSINYPYGESIFFTSAMPMINNLVKIFGPSADTAGVAIINLIMLFSIPAGALFLYGIFKHIKLPWIYAAVCATGIAFFSPQVMRMSGHYSLSWVFFIPAMIYLLMRFYDYPSVRKSWIIAALTLLAATTHLYFFVFFAVFSGMYWAALFISRDRGFGRLLFVLKHFSIQLVLPYFLLQLLVMYSNTASDRTEAPWGYFVYHSNTTGVFFPLGKFYQPLFDHIAKAEPVEFEGVSYIGLAALLGLLVIIGAQLLTLVRRRFSKVLSVTDNKPVNIFFWASVFLLWFSFGHPFIRGHEDWLTHLGPLRQFRAIGRFAWAFYYLVNIVAVWRMYQLFADKKILRYLPMLIVPLLLFTDLVSTTRDINFKELLNNRIPELEDESNQLPADQWMRSFNPKKYQAILPLPYFHIGSENISRPASDPEIIKQSFIVSLKTGLPIMAVSASRTSLSQTVKLISLVMDPSQPMDVLRELPDKRPLLLIVRDGAIDENEKRLLALAKPLAESAEYKVYELDPADILAMTKQLYRQVKTEMDSTARFNSGPFRMNDSAAQYVYRSFDDQKGIPFRGKGSFTAAFRQRTDIYDAEMAVPGEYRITFWMNRMTKDVFPRTVFEVFCNDTTSAVEPFYLLTNGTVRTRMVVGDWGLIEIPLTVPVAHAHLKISVWNDEIRSSDTNQIDEMLIFPVSTHLYQVSGDTIYRDNRRYFPVR